jgi:tetratricopeptide (TPR) repeat protein
MNLHRLAFAVLSALAVSGFLTACGGKEARLAEHLQKGRDFYAAGNTEKALVELKNVLQIDPKTAEPYLIIGKLEEQRGNLQKAFGNYLRASELDPENTEVLTRLGKLYLFGGDMKNAIARIDEVLAKRPDDPAALTVKVALLARNGDVAGAIATGEKVIRLSPNHVDAYGALAGVYNSQGKPDAAVALFEQGIKANPKSLDLRVVLADLFIQTKAQVKAIEQFRDLIGLDPKRLEFSVSLARLYVGENDPGAGEKVLREAILVAPDDPQRKMALSEFLLAIGQRDKAEKELVAAIEANPEAYVLRFGLASLHLAAGSVENAEGDYIEIIKRAKLAPDGLRARVALASVRVEQERTAEAESLLAEVLKETPRDNAALLLRGQMALARGDTPSAIADFRAVTKDQPESLEVMMRLAQAHVSNREPQLAVETIGRAKSVRPGDPQARLLVAEVKASTGDRQGALSEVEAALKLDPNHAGALMRKADLEGALKKEGEAEKTLSKLGELHPEDPQVPYRKGMLLLGQGRLPGAESDFHRALALRPGAIEPLTALSNVYFAQQQPDKAVKLLEHTLAQKPRQFAIEVLLGRVHERAGRLAPAEASLRKAVEDAPEAEVVHQELAAFFERQGNANMAVEILNSALASMPQSVGLRMRLADLQRKAGSMDLAIAQYEEILKVRPGNDAAANNLASLLLDEHRDKVSFDRALTLTTRFKTSANVAYQDTLGWAHARAGKLDEALPLLRRVAEVAPDVPVFQYHLGAALFQKGDRVEAKLALQRAANAKEDFPGKRDAKSLLEQT